VTERVAGAASRLLERRTSRRGVLVKAAVAGSALAVGPLRYLLRPGSALAVVTCRTCGGGRCCDGWTEFCCVINGGVNACPPYSYMAGWWKCTSYRGRQLCKTSGVRYYIDCNRKPGSSCPGGCRCANGSCANRSTCCNVFRYGQCNTQVPGVTEVVCRVVKCENPCRLYPGTCNCTTLVDDRTCSHEAPCLSSEGPPPPPPPYTGLYGGGGGGYG
jgi:hypothetical protein